MVIMANDLDDPTAIGCGSFYGAGPVRLTPVDSCGAPIYGACSAITESYTALSWEPEIDDEEPDPVRTASGKVCARPKQRCAEISYYTVNLTLCVKDPLIVNLLLPKWRPVKDGEGKLIGNFMSSELGCDTGYALETWTPASTEDVACRRGAGDAVACNNEYTLFPLVFASGHGEVTREGEGVTIQYTGRARLGSGWGRGPYNVLLGPDGLPAPLPEKIGPKDFGVSFTTTVCPPEPACECVPVERPVPDPADLDVEGVRGERPRVTACTTFDNHGFGDLVVNWGDDTPEQTVRDGQRVCHKYPADKTGEVTIQACDKQTPVICQTKKITLPLPPDEPVLDLKPDPDDTSGMGVCATVSVPPQASKGVKLEWGDGVTEEISEADLKDGQKVTRCRPYGQPGIFTVRVTRNDKPKYRVRETISVPIGQPPTVTPSVAAKVLTLTVDNHGQGLTRIDWGDGSQSDGPATDGGTVTHTYKDDGKYTVTVTSRSNPLAKTTTEVTIGSGGLTPPKA
ncbi:PKD domain-containing protein [Streptomyces alboflavus]|uniref:PKD domain-containing protein n=1 Tax=Streptomyces alboflavus TaxID=67267 RepID=UPI0036A02EFB